MQWEQAKHRKHGCLLTVSRRVHRRGAQQNTDQKGERELVRIYDTFTRADATLNNSFTAFIPEMVRLHIKE